MQIFDSCKYFREFFKYSDKYFPNGLNISIDYKTKNSTNLRFTPSGQRPCQSRDFCIEPHRGAKHRHRRNLQYPSGVIPCVKKDIVLILFTDQDISQTYHGVVFNHFNLSGILVVRSLLKEFCDYSALHIHASANAERNSVVLSIARKVSLSPSPADIRHTFLPLTIDKG